MKKPPCTGSNGELSARFIQHGHHAIGQFIDAEWFGQQIHAVVEYAVMHHRMAGVAPYRGR